MAEGQKQMTEKLLVSVIQGCFRSFTVEFFSHGFAVKLRLQADQISGFYSRHYQIHLGPGNNLCLGWVWFGCC